MRKLIFRNLFFGGCLTLVFIIGAMRSHPFFGKWDFFFVEGRPWWPAWRDLIRDTRARGKVPVYTDYITGYILAGVFGEQTVVNVGDDKIPRLIIEDMEEGRLPAEEFLSNAYIQAGRPRDFRCVINLKGYQSSWVPGETGHWRSQVADTSKFYSFANDMEKPIISRSLRGIFHDRCVIYE